MSVYNDIAGQERGNKERREHKSQTVANYARKFPRGHWSFGLDQKKNGTEPFPTNQMDPWIEWQKNDGKFLSIRSSDISCLQCNETIELFLRTVISTNQLIIYGAIADLCDEVPKRVRAPGKPAATEHLEKVEIPTVLQGRKFYHCTAVGVTCGKNTSENSSNCQKTRNYPN